MKAEGGRMKAVSSFILHPSSFNFILHPSAFILELGGEIMSDSVLVTGGAGFIGSHIVDTLLAAGYDVSVVDDLHTGKRENVNPAARFHRVDIRDAAALDAVFAAERPVAVLHQAAWADVRGSLVDPAGYATVNVIGTLNLLEAARRHGTRKIVFASTGGAIYGDPAELPATEACPPDPLDPYGASKLSCEVFIATYRHNYGLDFCALRYGNVYGPRQDPFGEAGVVAIFTGKLLRHAAGGARFPSSTATACRAAISSTWATWRAPTCSRCGPAAASTTWAPASPPTSTPSSASWRA